MSKYHLFRRALIAIMIVPLSALLACASGRANAPPPEPDPSVAIGDVKTIESLFAGRFPGVVVTAADGGGLQIRIRGGGNTFGGSDQPLYLIDETPIAAGPRGVVFVNPYDIVKIEVLKNPADIAVYGVQGANGVIKITTKRPGRR